MWFRPDDCLSSVQTVQYMGSQSLRYVRGPTDPVSYLTLNPSQLNPWIDLVAM